MDLDHEQRILIVDDEPLGRRSVARQVALVFPKAEVREARDGFEALTLVERFAPTLVFLDVDMPELSGLDVLRQLREPRPKVIFVTAFEHFALSAFDENACDYLVKPFTPERFAAAAARARLELDADRKLHALEQSLSQAGQFLTRLALRAGSRVDVVALADVSCLLSEGHYTYLHKAGRQYVTELTLVHLEQRLDPASFVRVHRNALVNLAHTLRIAGGAEPAVELDDGMRVPISRRNRRALLARLALGRSRPDRG
jgi:two-component system LytT family response regulator